MKPIQLEIAGLHSFRDPQVISFADLSDTGVFGIFGPTGSGKSTILDAMTLALFGTVGRAEHNTRGILNHAESSVRVSFEFEIGHNPRMRYRVERSYRRKDEIAVQNVRTRLIDCSGPADVVLADKDSEVTGQIRQILGLDPEDFTRAVVLPQGKFAEFLNLKGSDRNRMLQRLFSLERYGDDLQQKVKSQYETVQRELDLILAQQLGMGDASPEAVSEAGRTLTDAEALERGLNQQLVAARQAHSEAKQTWERQNELAETERLKQSHDERAREVEVWEATLGACERARRVLPFATTAADTESTKIQAQTKLHQWDQQLQALQSQAESARLQWQTLEQAWNDEQPKFEQRRRTLEEAVRLQGELNVLVAEFKEVRASFETLNRRYSEANEGLERIRRDRSEKDSALKSLRERAEQRAVTADRRMQWQTIQEALAFYRTSLANERKQSIQLQDRTQVMHGVRHEWEQQQAALTELKNQATKVEAELAGIRGGSEFDTSTLHKEQAAMERIRQLAKQLDAEETQLAEVHQNRGRAEQQLTVVLGEYESAEKHHQSLKSELAAKEAELRSLQTQHAAVLLAGRLHEGGVCPVCGSTDHPAPAQNATDDATRIQAIEDDLAATRVRATELEATVSQQGGRKVELQTRLHSYSDSIEALGGRTQALRHELLQTNPLIPVASIGEVWDWLALQTEAVTKRVNELAAFAETTETIHREKERLAKLLHEQGLATAKLDANISGLEEEIGRIQQEVEAAGQGLQTAEQQVLQAVSQIPGAPTIMGDTLVAWVQQGSQQLAEDDRFVEQVKQTERTLLADVERLEAEQAAVEKQVFELQAERSKVEGQLQERRSRGTQLQTQIQSLAEGKSPVEQLQITERMMTARVEAVRTAEATSRQLDADVTQAEREFAVAQTTHRHADEAFNKAQALLVQALQNEQFVTAEQVKDAILSAEEEVERRENVRVYHERGKKIADKREALLQALGDRRLTEEQWLEVEQQAADCERTWKEAVSAVGAAKKQLDTVGDNHTRWLACEEQRATLAAQLEKLTQLRQVLSGNKFVEFVAQEQLDFVARHASDRLKQLTRNRYALEVASDGRFVMRDDFNGGVRRPVSTLSGGETFLTSLALALSLSTQIQLQGRYPLEFFFLDEGFGTLDTDLLDVVMTTLEKLHVENMTIGVISHVPELQQRLQRKLIVTPADASGIGTKLRVERA